MKNLTASMNVRRDTARRTADALLAFISAGAALLLAIQAAASETESPPRLGHLPSPQEYQRYVEQTEIAPANGDYVWIAESWKALKIQALEMNRRSLRLIDIEVSINGEQTHYLGVWREGTGRYAVWTCPSWDAFNERWQESAIEGLQLVDIEVYQNQQGETLYLGVFREDMDETKLWKDQEWNSINSSWLKD